MLFKKNAKMGVITIPFVNSLLWLLYFIEIVLEYDFSTLMNKNWIVCTR
jgi:hypothetical protein